MDCFSATWFRFLYSLVILTDIWASHWFRFLMQSANSFHLPKRENFAIHCLLFHLHLAVIHSSLGGSREPLFCPPPLPWKYLSCIVSQYRFFSTLVFLYCANHMNFMTPACCVEHFFHTCISAKLSHHLTLSFLSSSCFLSQNFYLTELLWGHTMCILWNISFSTISYFHHDLLSSLECHVSFLSLQRLFRGTTAISCPGKISVKFLGSAVVLPAIYIHMQ